MRQECVKKAVPAGISVLSDSCVPRSGHFPYSPSRDMPDPGHRLSPDGFPTAAFPAAFPFRNMPGPGRRLSPDGFPTAVFPRHSPPGACRIRDTGSVLLTSRQQSAQFRELPQ